MALKLTRKAAVMMLFAALLALPAHCQEADPPATATQTAALAPAPGLTDIIGVVDGYLGAIRGGDWSHAYSFLSAASRASLSPEAWTNSGQQRLATPVPEASVGYLVSGAQSYRITGASISSNSAKVYVEAVYALQSTLSLVNEDGGWKVDLPTTDQTALLAIGDAIGRGITQKSGDAAAPPADLRALLAPFVASHRINQVEMGDTSANIKLTEEAVVMAAVSLERQGALWRIADPIGGLSARPRPAGVPLAAPVAQQPQKPAPKPEPKPGEMPEDKHLPTPRYWRP